MGIGTSLGISLTGLKTNQLQLEITSNNIANAGSAGYSRRRVVTHALIAGDRTLGVSPAVVERELNTQVQGQWRNSHASLAYAETRNDIMSRLDLFYGGPEDPSSIDSLFNGFKKAVETLATSPENAAARASAASSANTLASRLRGLSNDIQTLRQEAETGLAGAVKDVNEILKRIAGLDRQIISLGAGNQSIAGLADERDAAIDQLSEYVDIRVEEQRYGGVAIRTVGGTFLYDDEPIQLAFDEHGMVTPDSLYATDSSRGVGTITVASGPGMGMDLFRDGSFRSGKIAALRQLRDETLVTAQAQLDTLASEMSLAISNRAVTGTAATSGAASGFVIDLDGIQQGNSFKITYTDGSGSHTKTFVAHDGTGSPGDNYTADPDDTVVPLDISGGMASILSQISTEMGASFAVTNPSGSQIQILDDGASATTDVNSMSASITNSGLSGGDAAFSLFIDSATGGSYTRLYGADDKLRGFSSRIAINPDVLRDPAYMVKMTSSTAPADDTRPRALATALTETRFTFSAEAGIGTKSSPFSGSIEDFFRQVISWEGSEADSAKQLAEGQAIVTANLDERYNGSREVNLDNEMAKLIELQTAYQSNARVLTVAREMLDMLMQVL